MEDPLIPMINVIVNAADARKATSISAFRISSITEITTFMVIVEGTLDSKHEIISLKHISEREMIYLLIFSVYKPLNHLDLLFLANVR
jgi:ribosomal silencing factor RsfS